MEKELSETIGQLCEVREALSHPHEGSTEEGEMSMMYALRSMIKDRLVVVAGEMKEVKI